MYLDLLLGHDGEDDGDHGPVQLVLHDGLLLQAGQPAKERHCLLPVNN